MVGRCRSEICNDFIVALSRLYNQQEYFASIRQRSTVEDAENCYGSVKEPRSQQTMFLQMGLVEPIVAGQQRAGAWGAAAQPRRHMLSGMTDALAKTEIKS